jgi:hypothetical protein
MGPCDPQGGGCRAKTQAYITTVSEQVKSMANLARPALRTTGGPAGLITAAPRSEDTSCFKPTSCVMVQAAPLLTPTSLSPLSLGTYSRPLGPLRSLGGSSWGRALYTQNSNRPLSV